MIEINDKKDCCGCNACGDVCGHNAITFITDKEGFWYPSVNKDLCTNCGLCERVCPNIHSEDLKHNDLPQSECYAAINNNIEVRFDSTSGGLFSAMADMVYKEGGYVGGAVFNDDFKSVRQFISADKNDLERLRSSKYLQSDASGFYRQVRECVKTGKPVLVCGTPCQMGALRRFLGKDYDNLIIVDFICRGINSPKIFKKYIEYLEEIAGANVIYFKAKNKELGWRNLTTKVVFKNKKVIYQTKDDSPFTIGYLATNVYSRPSCYDCKFKGFPRMADITVADFWGVEKIADKKLDDNIGTSLVMVNSTKGRAFFEGIKKNLSCESVAFDSILSGNPALVASLPKPIVDRESFYDDLDKIPYKEIIDKYIIPAGAKKVSLKRQLFSRLGFFKKVLKASGFSVVTIWRNIKYNFLSKNITTDFPNGGYMLIYPHSVIEIHPKSTIKLKGTLSVGSKKFRRSKLETRLLIEEGASLTVDDWFMIGYGSDVEIFRNAEMYLGGKGGINCCATIICAEKIVMEKDVMIGRNVTIRDNNGGHIMSTQGYKNSRPIFIGRHSWLCEGATLLAGAKLGAGAIIGAKALVFGTIPNNALVSGNPGKVVDKNIYWRY